MIILSLFNILFIWLMSIQIFHIIMNVSVDQTVWSTDKYRIIWTILNAHNKGFDFPLINASVDQLRTKLVAVSGGFDSSFSPATFSSVGTLKIS